jgi:hypothetical protein
VGISAILFYLLLLIVKFEEVHVNLGKIAGDTMLLAKCSVWLIVLMNSLCYHKKRDRVNGKKVSDVRLPSINRVTIFLSHFTAAQQW